MVTVGAIVPERRQFVGIDPICKAVGFRDRTGFDVIVASPFRSPRLSSHTEQCSLLTLISYTRALLSRSPSLPGAECIGLGTRRTSSWEN